jgi:small subunit ribosomal protein S20
MPIKQAAKKALRQSNVRRKRNDVLRNRYKSLVKETREFIADHKADDAKKVFVQATQALDKAAKQHIIHRNKASRLKSRLAKAIHVVATTKPAPKKKAAPSKAKRAVGSKTKAKATTKAKASK